ncbi:glycosyl hydrolase 115 family protein [Chryseobacterium takakiae]|uniref:Glycosyl hydrolase family 67 N-terminus n=1 Tax=Chryseobacterium takakiae TaxID=1302685 RepID=A0A1M4W8I6_9FLAO|nr:glycosyl hydrolase 115 family protein [Chryseobacterium takakiae]SHE77536.1 Glycosyl hydrolase family 67 N-terminus [Chryseobacterium takakiae]
MFRIYQLILACLFYLLHTNLIAAQQTSGITENITSDDKGFPIVSKEGKVADLLYDPSENIAVIRAAKDLQTDIQKVTGKLPNLATTETSAEFEIIIGTVGANKQIDQLISSKKIHAKDLKGKWESFVITTIDNSNSKKQLVIAGSDRRGTIYGIYEISKQLGVSPWHWWNDVPVQKRSSAYVIPGYFASGEPKVKYRGIFINDEEPAFGTWARTKFGGINSKMYANMFELLLRLRANYLWPAMWGKAFNEDDPLNPKIADEYGIVMGTSHHEPMMRAQKEWGNHRKEYGNGEWNYHTNKDALLKFWEDGFRRNKKYDNLVTMGMRGDGDEPMSDLGSAEANFKQLEQIMNDQRKVIEKVTGKPAKKTPQLWALYSEVLEYYDQGMKVPDDVIILLCDDNWGNVRRLPELNSKKHPGGYGMYYHVDLHGAPRAYQWLNMTQIPHMWEQLQLTYSYGVDKIWILNVGDLKPNEYPMDFFLNMAWNPTSFTQDNLKNYSAKFAEEHFGKANSKEIAEIINLYCKYNSRVSAEMLNDKTYNLQSGEFLQVRDSYLALETRALRQFINLDEAYKDTYKQIVLHPVRAMANLYDMYYAVAMNHKLADEKDLKANEWADYADECFARDASYTKNYNLNISNGKWNHMMDQTHIGYKSWDEPKEGNIKPAVYRITKEEANTGGYIFEEKNGVVAMEAEHFFEVKTSADTKWTVIPDLGRILSGIALMPYTEKTTGSAITYQFNLKNKSPEVKIHFIFDSTLPFKKGGHRVKAYLDKNNSKTIGLNQDLTWANNYTKMYPAAAARIVEKVEEFTVPANLNGNYSLTIEPLDPGIVLHKIIVDNGGYEETYLKMNESPYKR